MKVVVVGSGGREHALANSLAKTADEVIVTPGNGGIPNSTSTPATQLDADLFVIGPEIPLVDGIADELRSQGKVVFGPNKDGAQLEGSKAWMKEILDEAGVPTAKFGVFGSDQVNEAKKFLETMSAPYVVKTDGLAAGKGVLVTDSLLEAQEDVELKLSGQTFGVSGQKVVIEEGLVGHEVSLFAVCDGHKAVILQPSQDSKRLLDGDQGPNTGGMGAYSPVPFFSHYEADALTKSIIAPTLDVLKKHGIDYRGVLYCGIMVTDNGPYVLEYNVRFGDPDAAPVLACMTSDLTQLLYEAATGEIQTKPTYAEQSAVTVVLATENYPGTSRKGDPITGVDKADAVEGVDVFCAGVIGSPDDLYTNGGRVLDVTAVGDTIEQARDRAYEAVSYISFDGMQYRTDIGHQAIK